MCLSLKKKLFIFEIMKHKDSIKFSNFSKLLSKTQNVTCKPEFGIRNFHLPVSFPCFCCIFDDGLRQALTMPVVEICSSCIYYFIDYQI
jgi:hypothetical protein